MPRESSYEDGAVGGDSPVRLMRLLGDPAIPAVRPLAHSLVLGELLATEADETASSNGVAIGFSLDDRLEGFISGDTTGDDATESFGVGAFLRRGLVSFTGSGKANARCARLSIQGKN